MVEASALPLAPTHLDSAFLCTNTVNLDATQSSNAYDHKQEYYNYYNRYAWTNHLKNLVLINHEYILNYTACNNTHHHSIQPHMVPHIQQDHHRKFHRQMLHIYHQVTPQITIQHNFIPRMAIITLDSLEHRNKITRDITILIMINTMHITIQIIHLMLVHQDRAVVKISTLQRCLKVHQRRLELHQV